MNILIVDDDVIEIDNLTKGMPWLSWGIENVYYAYCIEDAKQIIETKPVEILLCDIEMPMGSGLDLIEWINQNKNLSIASVILTCHPEFEYARRAIELGCTDFLLKPVEADKLQDCIRKVQEIVIRNQKDKQYSSDEYLWLEVQKYHLAGSQEMLKFARRRGISTDNEYSVAVFSLKYSSPLISNITENIREFIIENVLRDQLADFSIAVLRTKPNQWAIIIQNKSVVGDSVETAEDIYKDLSDTIAFFADKYDSEAACYLSHNVQHQNVMIEIKKWLDIDERNVCTRAVFTQKINFNTNGSLLTPEEQNVWESLLIKKNYQELLNRMDLTLNSFQPWQIDKATLNSLAAEVLQEFAYRPELSFEKKTVENIWEQNGVERNSIRGFIEFFKSVFSQIETNIDDNTDGIVDKVKTYVSTHMDQNITREDISKVIGLTPDYLNRIFKKETGMGIKEYISLAKIDLCKDLLKNTDFLISDIANMVGCANSSYFTTFFKKYTGDSPAAYRKKYANNVTGETNQVIRL